MIKTYEYEEKYLIYKLSSEEMKEATRIDTALFPKFDVKRGLHVMKDKLWCTGRSDQNW